MRLALFTICSNNYLAYARVLLRSAARHMPEAALFLCLVDRRLDQPGLYEAGCEVVEAHTLPLHDWDAMAFRYGIMELNTAVKPSMMSHLLETLGFDAVLYFDPDIELFAPPCAAVDLLAQGASFVLTPHLCSPNEDRREPNDRSILRAGAYNLGFLGASRSDETGGVLAWWARHLRVRCLDLQPEGLFVDQKFMDLVPGLAPAAAICRDTSLNVAYWNLAQRTLEDGPEGWSVDGAPLTFFHFSGFNPADPDRLSKHDPRFVGALAPPLRRLTGRYAKAVLEAGHGDLARLPYAYGCFASGAPITAAIRARFREREPYDGNPFVTFEGAS